MLNCLSNDSKMQMRLNIKRHRQKLLQYLENTNDTVIKPKIKLVSNDIEKSNLNHNVKPTIASNTEVQTPKIIPTIKITNYRNKPTIHVKTYEAVINTKPNDPEVLTYNNIKKYKTRSSITANQLPPNIKVNIKDEPLSSFQLKQKPLPNIEIKDPKSPPAIKKLKEQLIAELFDSSSSEENDDNISVGNNDNWNEIYQTHNGSDVDENDSSNLRLMESVRYDGHKELANDISEEKYMYDSTDIDSPVVLDINNPTTNKKSRTRKPQIKIDQTKHRFRKPQDRSLHNAKERACRESIAKKFAILRKSCSYLNSNRRVPSKHSILLAAKKECDLLKHFEKKMLAEKKVLRKANEILKNRLTQIYSSIL
ncbi:uncharacterized protein LOC100162746 [Acyrthosiphon pisum]|uniref:BHLH domain-containing protein n=1 Tax=Acyrthosiphon pisum TaxID=7029 RepID=A0A8R1X1F8_ACYPI|nr:uncharacterized protein LOC100162746 [Acyrthosiphon pisum]XP_003242463.1 uncharacterized protein LOC100162746 [Acyrthosiphon pisum]XP_008180039.1 uncharacterized protein LOC100162746 [Acyrthosiphon pisum]XP_016657498.1 uncharacterized protein LOC100162746 [Acyrthosiphon pisum]|eukprot:XP_001950163.2 PREDICTED: uncharacterized protein LOC100162746 [Acyrthosiphon pisum]